MDKSIIDEFSQCDSAERAEGAVGDVLDVQVEGKQMQV